MAKEALKRKKRLQQEGRDALNGNIILPERTAEYDTHRKVPKRHGGTYTDEENVLVTLPVLHQTEHGTLKIRDAELELLKILMDARLQISKLYMASENRILAYTRFTDHLDNNTLEWLQTNSAEMKKKLTAKEYQIMKYIKGMNNPFVQSALKIEGLGALTIAFLLVYIDIKKAEYASALWKYVGLHTSSHERYTKGESGGGNKTLRTALYAFAISQIQQKGAYVDIYNNEKLKLSVSKKIVKTRNTQGQLIECMWCETKPSHRHGAAIRKMIKHFLADVWKVWRTFENLPTPFPYVQEKLGHTGIIQPEERGWIYKN